MSPRIPTRLLATQSDERLLALVRQGHERAFEALVHRYRRPLLSYCRRLGLLDAQAEDVLQHALLKSWLALSGGTEVRQLKAWLYRVVHNAAVNAMRDAAHEPARLADPSQVAGAGESDLDRGLATRQALAEVAALPPLQREVIVRTAVVGHSQARVASDLGLSDGAVRGLAYRARATLRAAATALTPPSLIDWLAGGATQGAPAPERLAELAAGGGTAGLGGLLVKGGAVAITAGTLITSTVVQVRDSARHAHRHSPPALAAIAAPGNAPATSSASGEAGSMRSHNALSVVSTSPVAFGRAPQRGSGGAALAVGGRGGDGAASEPAARVTNPSAGPRSPGSTRRGHSKGREVLASAPGSEGVEQRPTPRGGDAEGDGDNEGKRGLEASEQAGSQGEGNRSSGGGDQGRKPGTEAGANRGEGAGQGDESSQPGGLDGGRSGGSEHTEGTVSEDGRKGPHGAGSREDPRQGDGSQAEARGMGSQGDGPQGAEGRGTGSQGGES